LPAILTRLSPIANTAFTTVDDPIVDTKGKGSSMRRRWLTALPVAIVLMVAACGGSGDAEGIASLEGDSDDSTATTEATATTVDSEQAMLQFAQCMRDHGIDMPDPTMDENGNIRIQVSPGGGEGGEFDPAEREAMQAAREACSQYLEGITQQFDRPDMTEMQDLMLEYAACMREQGIDMPDPDFTTEGGGQGPGAQLGFNPGDFDPSDPAFQAANEVCQDVFGASGMPGVMFGFPGGDMRPGGGTPPEGDTLPEGGEPPGSDTTFDTVG
jgi:hypothetical protein